ncbi:hypothetical protein [Flavobacterium sp. ASV13]|uniref:hypothetical protein n=1 Tax=Flavobacterium sp. ASV13 TaxID=1506583 RepID=UPI0005505182|nr:hypothetical protein [Flavobacterium sp. ASV13]
MKEIKQLLIDEYKILNEYYLFSLYTYEENSHFTKKFKSELTKIKRKIKSIKPDFIFEATDEIIKIDYKIFNVNIDNILRGDWQQVSYQDFNFIMHRCSGGAFKISPLIKIWDKENRENYMYHHGDDYRRVRRNLILNDILN